MGGVLGKPDGKTFFLIWCFVVVPEDVGLLEELVEAK